MKFMADPKTKKAWAGEAHHFDVDENKTLFFISLVSLHLLSHNSFDFSTKLKWNTNTNTFILVGSTLIEYVCTCFSRSRSRSGHKESTFLFYYCNFCCGYFCAYDKKQYIEVWSCEPILITATTTTTSISMNLV